MEDDLIRRAEDLAAQCERRGAVTHTNFLTPAEGAQTQRRAFAALVNSGAEPKNTSASGARRSASSAVSANRGVKPSRAAVWAIFPRCACVNCDSRMTSLRSFMIMSSSVKAFRGSVRIPCTCATGWFC